MRDSRTLCGTLEKFHSDFDLPITAIAGANGFRQGRGRQALPRRSAPRLEVVCRDFSTSPTKYMSNTPDFADRAHDKARRTHFNLKKAGYVGPAHTYYNTPFFLKMQYLNRQTMVKLVIFPCQACPLFWQKKGAETSPHPFSISSSRCRSHSRRSHCRSRSHRSHCCSSSHHSRSRPSHRRRSSRTG